MKLYLDDDAAKKSLVARLRKAGHTVVQPADAALSGPGIRAICCMPSSTV
jgi:hypothetical protein